MLLSLVAWRKESVVWSDAFTKVVGWGCQSKTALWGPTAECDGQQLHLEGVSVCLWRQQMDRAASGWLMWAASSISLVVTGRMLWTASPDSFVLLMLGLGFWKYQVTGSEETLVGVCHAEEPFKCLQAFTVLRESNKEALPRTSSYWWSFLAVINLKVQQFAHAKRDHQGFHPPSNERGLVMCWGLALDAISF